MSPPRILVCNDDGIASDGLLALVEAVAPLGEVWVCAPDVRPPWMLRPAGKSSPVTTSSTSCMFLSQCARSSAVAGARIDAPITSSDFGILSGFIASK